jgi:hypothetical protein
MSKPSLDLICPVHDQEMFVASLRFQLFVAALRNLVSHAHSRQIAELETMLIYNDSHPR